MIGRLFQGRTVSSMLTRRTFLLPFVAVCAFSGLGGSPAAAESKLLPVGWDAKQRGTRCWGVSSM